MLRTTKSSMYSIMRFGRGAIRRLVMYPGLLNNLATIECWYVFWCFVMHFLLLPLNNSQKKFRDALDEVYELNRFPLSQNRMRCALENDTFCSEFEEEVKCFPYSDVFQIHMVFMVIDVYSLSFSYFSFSVSWFHSLPQGSKSCSVCLPLLHHVWMQSVFRVFSEYHGF